MVFNATFNNISVISWRSVLKMEETGENLRPVANHWQYSEQEATFKKYALLNVVISEKNSNVCW
jgi:hypothetical protein